MGNILLLLVKFTLGNPTKGNLLIFLVKINLGNLIFTLGNCILVNPQAASALSVTLSISDYDRSQ